MPTEDELRNFLSNGNAADGSSAPDPERIISAAHAYRRQRRHTRTAIVGGALAVVAIAGGVVAIKASDFGTSHSVSSAAANLEENAPYLPASESPEQAGAASVPSGTSSSSTNPSSAGQAPDWEEPAECPLPPPALLWTKDSTQWSLPLIDPSVTSIRVCVYEMDGQARSTELGTADARNLAQELNSSSVPSTNTIYCAMAGRTLILLAQTGTHSSVVEKDGPCGAFTNSTAVRLDNSGVYDHLVTMVEAGTAPTPDASLSPAPGPAK